MNTLWMLLAAGFMLFAAACAGAKEDAPAEMEVRGDTTDVPKAAPSLAPGAANLSATVLACEEAGEGYACRVRVQEVQGYGPATPPLAPGAEIAVRIGNTLTAEQAEPVSALLSPGNTVALTLRHRQGQVMGGGDEAVWTVVRLRPLSQ